jgi:hypothetical protein
MKLASVKGVLTLSLIMLVGLALTPFVKPLTGAKGLI